jgi:glutamyl-tRNA reductase
MNLLVVGCNFRTAPLDLRERLAFPETAPLKEALTGLSDRCQSETVILSTCNRVEVYLARLSSTPPLTSSPVADFLAETGQVSAAQLQPHLYEHGNSAAVRHLFSVVASLDSMIVGEAQIAGQVKHAYELAQEQETVGAFLHALFQHARLVGKRVRSETGIAAGHVSVSSAAVEHVQQVFERFDDKTILVIGAGKMGELTLRHLRGLAPRRIWVVNRSPEKAAAVAAGCGGTPLPWDDLDQALAEADIVLSTTGAPEPIVTQERWQRIIARRSRGSVVILDIAVPRDFDPRIHDGEQTCLFNIDDLQRIRERTLAERRKHVAAAEAIVDQEAARFLKDWQRRRLGPIIARLTQAIESWRRDRLQELFDRLDGRLNEEDRQLVEGYLRKDHNHFLHVLITALDEETRAGGGQGLLDTLRRLFRWQD